jgi:hypothetical protein
MSHSTFAVIAAAVVLSNAAACRHEPRAPTTEVVVAPTPTDRPTLAATPAPPTTTARPALATTPISTSLTSCEMGRPIDTKAPPPRPRRASTPGLEATMKALVASIRNGRFGSDVLQDDDAPAASVRLASTSGREEVVIAALVAMEREYASTPDGPSRWGPASAVVTPNYHAAVRRHLNSPVAAVQAAAIAAARHSVTGPLPVSDVRDTLVSFACDDSPSRRFAALTQLAQLESPRPDLEQRAMHAALDTGPAFLLAGTLKLAHAAAYRIHDRERLRMQAERLLGHPVAGVRGQALGLLAELGRIERELRPELALVIRPYLEDPSAHVKARALSALGEVADTASLPQIMALIDRDDDTSYSLRGWHALSGRSGKLEFYGATYHRLGLAAVDAAAAMSWATSERLVVKHDWKSREVDIAAARGETRAWYDKIRASLPP